MPCSAASTLTSISSVPVLPQLTSVSAGDRQALTRWGQQILAQVQAAGGATGVNVVPQQYALVAGSTLPPIASTTNCTVALDAATQLFGYGSYKISITGSPATVEFSAKTAWPLQPNWQWIVSFFQTASAAVAGSVTITTAAGTAYSTTFTTGTAGLALGRLFDVLNLGADSSAAFGLSFTFTGGAGKTVWLDGLQLEPYFGRAIQPSPFVSTSGALTADNVPGGSSYAVPTLNTGGGENLVQNGNFTIGLAGWSKTNDASTMTLVSHALPGGQTGNALQLGNALEYEGVYANPFDFVPGATYLYSVWVYSSVAASYQLRLNESDYLSNGTIAPNTWTLVQATYTVPTTVEGASAIGQFGVTGETASAQTYLLWGASVVKVRSSDTEVSDGTTYARFPLSHFDNLTSRRIATAAGAVSPLGAIVTAGSTVVFSYTSTTSSITISWTSGSLYRMDGTATAVNSGSVTVTGLSASTTYYAAAYYDEIAQAISFVTGYSGAVGSPAILYLGESPSLGQQAQLNSRLNLGYIPMATPASGGGGGNGTSGCCLRGSQLIELEDGAVIGAVSLRQGDLLTSPEGPTRITRLRIEPWDEWYEVEFDDGRALQVAADHRFMDPGGAQVCARDLKLQGVLQARGKYVSVVALRLSLERDAKVSIEVADPHVYYVDGVLAHNKALC